MEESKVFEKATWYDRDRFFGASWRETKRDFLEQWVPAQNRAADAGLAPRVFDASAHDKTLRLAMQRVEGRTLLQVVEDWRNEESDDKRLIARLAALLRRAETFHRAIYVATGGGHPDWAARNVLVDERDQWFAIDFENWVPDDVFEDDGGVFASDLAQSFHARPVVYRFLLRSARK